MSVFHRFSWLLMLTLAMGGTYKLTQQVNNDRLVGVWVFDTATTLRINGKSISPEVSQAIDALGVNYTLRIGRDGVLTMTNATGAIEVQGNWSDAPKMHSPTARVLIVKDDVGREIYGFQWTLIDDDHLKTRLPKGDLVGFRRARSTR